MLLLDLSLSSAAENLALDEALLEQLDQQGGQETLRFWEMPAYCVVLGRSSRVDVDVDREACLEDHVPVFRRCSGGLSIVAGPGCLMYSVVLDLRRRPHLQAIEKTHCEVLGRLAAAVGRQFPAATVRGISDLALGDRKFSGNSLRCKRNAALYHGTLLYDFPLDRIERYLRPPPRQPDYRRGRSHQQFVTNIALDTAHLKRELAAEWAITGSCGEAWRTLTEQLVSDRYSLDSWNYRL